MIYEKLNTYKNNIAFIEKDISFSYDDIITFGKKFYNHINSTGVLCLIVAGNNSATVISYLSSLEHNIPILLVNQPKRITDLINILEKYKPRYIFIDHQYTNDERIQDITRKHIYSMFGYIIIETIYNIDYDINYKLSLLLTTSGSTGTTKYVRLSKENILSNALSIIEYLNISANDKVITTLPFSYSYGLSIINTHLLSGATIVLSEYSIIQREFWKLIEAYKISTFGGVPYTYEMIQRLKFDRISTSHIAYLTQAGGRLNTAATMYYIDECNKKNINFYKMYGQTEATARISYIQLKDIQNKIDSIGKAIPYGTLYIVDENGNKLENNTSGEIIYEGNNVSLGYAENCYDLNKDDENNKVLHTGDIGYYDNDGFFYITGRKKRFLKVFGNRVNLDELENNLNSAGCSCACSGIDDKIQIYVCTENMKNKADELLKEILDIHPSGYNINIVKEITRNSAGKIQYNLLG